jgi:primosomal protein N' (replication factor Y)
MRVVSVALPVPLEHAFDYTLPSGVAVAPGERVLVPYGPRQLAGMVVGVDVVPDPSEPPRALRPITRVLHDAPALPPAVMRAVLGAAAEALSPPGMALAAALPPGTAPRPTVCLALSDAGAAALLRGEAPAPLRRLLEALREEALAEPSVRKRFPESAAALPRLLRLGWLRRTARAAAPRAKHRTERVYTLAAELMSDPLPARLARAPRQRAVIESLRAGAAALPASAAVSALVRAGHVTVQERVVLRAQPGARVEAAAPAPELTGDQSSAASAIADAIRARAARRILLYGVTGSGKTEVYLRAAAAARAQGRGVIVLVPEISLTHQIVDRFRARFGDEIAVQHSALSAGERLDQWRQIEAGDLSIVIGARSAIFAPLAKCGLIVIDEEHDAAYATDEGFRYDARDVGARLAREYGCPLVLGSATPDVATMYAVEQGAIARLVLPTRVARRPMPEVEIVSMASEPRRRGRGAMLSGLLRRRLAETLRAGQQAILLLNRRGFATHIYCFACGHAVRCAHCDISLVYHATGVPSRRDRPEQGELRCHYCGYTEPPPTACAGCGAAGGALMGVGTERVEEDVAAMYPHARVARLDRDTSVAKGAQQRILAAFHRGETDILVGTQMVAKGHDVPNVTLVGVLAADLGLHFPDYRAGERTFQLLTQVAGRAGRGADPGRVVIQTFLPEHYAIAHARTHDYGRFYTEELARRRPHGYPPFRSLLRVDVSGLDLAEVEHAASEMAAYTRAAVADGDAFAAASPAPASHTAEASGALACTERVDVLGPAPAPIVRLRDRFRWQVLVLGPERALRPLARSLAARGAQTRGDLTVRVVPRPAQML